MRHLVLVTVFALCATAAGAHERDHGNHGRRCDPSLKHRSAAQVLDDHRAALAAGDWDAVACNYAEDAVVIQDGAVTTGRANIVNDLEFIAGLFGGVWPAVNDEVIVSILNDRAEMGRVLWSIQTQCVQINDGADTYIIKNGRIQAQTAHGFPTFTCPPPGP